MASSGLGLPNFERFSVHADESTVGARWKRWISKLENLMCALDIKEDSRKKALLLHYAGDEVYEIFESFSDADKGIDAVTQGADGDQVPNEYGTLKQSLTNHFTPKQNTSFEVFKFRQLKQGQTETMEAFHIRLRNAAANCEFHDTDREILAQIVEGCVSNRIRRKALKDNMKLKDVLAEAKALELAENRAAEIEGVVDRAVAVNAVNAVTSRGRGCGHRLGGRFQSRGSPSRRGQHADSRLRGGTSHGGGARAPAHGDGHFVRGGGHAIRGGGRYGGGGHSGGTSSCRYCGGPFPHSTPCPARGKRCRACGKEGHYARVCNSRPKVSCVVRETESENDYALQDDLSALHLRDEHEYYDHDYVFAVSNDIPKTPIFKTLVLNTPTEFLIDTGASVNIMNYNTFLSLQTKPTLMSPCPRIFAYNSKTPLPVLGYFQGEMRHNENGIKATFYVMRADATPCRNLLCNETAQALNLIQFALSSHSHDIADEFHDLFGDQLGKIKDVSVKLHIDPDVRPVAQRHRRIPFHVRKDVEAELKRLEDMDIIEKVDGPTPWISPVVVVPKKSHGVRVCVDMREANKAIGREKHPMPTIDDLIADMNGSKVFSKLDMTNAYHQLELDEESRYITTFSTHVGLRRYKRLLFGVNAASEIFQNAIAGILHDIPGAKNLSDDIIIHGKDQAAHDRSLQATLKRLNEKGARLNKEKCVFSTSELTFFGHVFGKKGVQPDPEKIKTITESPAPKTVSEIRSFLGMTQYVSRFVPGYATLTEPLRRLTQKTTTWKWEKEEQKAFEALKQALVGSEVMAYFNSAEPSKVLVDASPVGLGAMLTQNGKVICYASRALTPTEQRYSQTEKEMLAVVYGAEHFHLYLYGAPFTVVTDHKPLLGIVNSQKPATARMERWRLRLMPYTMTLTYAPGRDEKNPADYISRHPHDVPSRDNAGEAYIAYVVRNGIPKSMTLQQVKEATAGDQALQRVMLAIQSGRWHDPGLEEFSRVKEELSIHDGLILRQHRIVIPNSLRQQAIAIAHQAHQGIVKTKQCIREKIWFPGIDKLVEETVKSCIPCQASYPGHSQREPLQPTPLPPEPWSSIAIDFAGPFPSGDYLLVVVDEYSRFPEVEIVSSTSARTVIPKLETIFSRQGLPTTVKTDNGPPFNGEEFSNFLSNFGIAHRKIAPLWPEANGEVERFMATLNKAIRSCIAEGKPWKPHLNTFLRLYRGTPHTSTKVSPFEALTGRTMKIGLPIFPPNFTPPTTHTKVQVNDQASKEKMRAYTDDKRHTRPSNLQPGDYVLVKQKRENKLTPPYSPLPYMITQKKGSMVSARRGNVTVTRNSTHFKPVRGMTPACLHGEEEEEEEEVIPEPEAAHTPTTKAPQPLQPPKSRAPQPLQSPKSRAPQPFQSPRPRVPKSAATPSASPGAQEPETRPLRQRRPPAYLKDYET